MHFEPPFRSREVLDHARGQPCTLRIPGVCCGDPATVVSCHIRDRHKGMGTKASDHSIVFGCVACHAFIDVEWVHSDIPEAEILRTILRAMQETWAVLIRDEVIGFPHDKPKPFAERKTKPRKPTDLRTKIPAGRKLESNGSWPKGKKLQSRNDLRRPE